MAEHLLKTSLGRLRIVAIIEGVSYLLLAVTMILKYRYDMPYPNLVVGMIHGVFFILYVLMVLQVGYLRKWTLKKIFLALVASIIPFGTFYAEKKLFRD